MGKLIFLILFFSFSANAIDPIAVLTNELSLLNQIEAGLVGHKPIIENFEHNELFEKTLADKNKRIGKNFKVPNFFKKSTRFWFTIYTRIESHKLLVHDKENLNIVYEVIDFTKLKSSKVNYHQRLSLQSKWASERLLIVKQELASFIKGDLNPDRVKHYKYVFDKAGLKLPTTKHNRKIFLKARLNNLRTQTGQKDFIMKGIDNLMQFEKTILSYFKQFRLPKELLAIAFLESSFNTSAKSKVGATGVWQFMKGVGRYFFKVNRSVDHRLNPIISTLGALHLLKQNKMILKRWDLAVPAYNSGMKHLLKARKKFKTKVFSLERFLTEYSHDNIGFASQNFYSEFLALVHVLAYKNEIYNKKYIASKDFVNVYVNKCSIRPSKFKRLLKNSDSNVDILNAHFRRPRRKYKKGSIFVTTANLTSRKYRKVSLRNLRKRYPKNLYKLAWNQSCSTR